MKLAVIDDQNAGKIYIAPAFRDFKYFGEVPEHVVKFADGLQEEIDADFGLILKPSKPVTKFDNYDLDLTAFFMSEKKILKYMRERDCCNLVVGQ